MSYNKEIRVNLTRWALETAPYWQNVNRDHNVEYTTAAFRDFVTNDLTAITLSNVNPVLVYEGHAGFRGTPDPSLLDLFTETVYSRGIGGDIGMRLTLRLNNLTPNEEIHLKIALGWQWWFDNPIPDNFQLKVNGTTVLSQDNAIWLTSRQIVSYDGTANSSGEVLIELIHDSTSVTMTIGGIILQYDKDQSGPEPGPKLYFGSLVANKIYVGSQEVKKVFIGQNRVL